MQTISLLGATGSIGRSAVDVIRRHTERWRVKSVAGGSRIPELVEAVRDRKSTRLNSSHNVISRMPSSA